MVDNRLLDYWNNAYLWHRTGDDLWLNMLELQSIAADGPGSRAASRLLAQIQKGEIIGKS
jgi:hypothetical protein